jgi:hypothetical protein
MIQYVCALERERENEKVDQMVEEAPAVVAY